MADLTFETLAKEMGRNEVFVASIFYGHAKPSPEDITVRNLQYNSVIDGH